MRETGPCLEHKIRFKKQRLGMEILYSHSPCRPPLSGDSYKGRDMFRDKESKNIMRKFNKLWDEG
ncbi:hypothetical protein [Methanolobus halotolerans]|uniref:Uncharacterized protein n=1 Tax=Methanolobus halotolerans TaxID=2052935 RepID=A0A4E0QRV0_9EURY|nr:hypothetical protein [Methanolobus halotolerans]TGC09431.1 hypothetical protein CUN85_06270 [Methanolobus halotolerans]